MVRFRYKSDDLIAAAGQPERIVKRIPWVHHWTRDIMFSPDGKATFAYGRIWSPTCSLKLRSRAPCRPGSRPNPPEATWDTEERRALSYDPEGYDEKSAATGLRNCTGIAIQPATEHPQWGNAFVTLHGSWNRAEGTRYKVVRLLFYATGKPTGEYYYFICNS